ncbi:RNA polymerase sigma factor SigF [Streptomyces varsoviensis]|uniref:RNA polymerase sigma factor SigF n=1 Tax=Streptomyces varsoviensis TaxID=67373 RepID=UPI001FE236F7|nr:RNA polymerase sigma factor SigF [Streptomyces varsoviensis]
MSARTAPGTPLQSRSGADGEPATGSRTAARPGRETAAESREAPLEGREEEPTEDQEGEEGENEQAQGNEPKQAQAQEQAPEQPQAPEPTPAQAEEQAPAQTEAQAEEQEQVPPPESPTHRRERRGADARALTQVLFKEIADLEPGTSEHARVRAALIEANLPLVRYAAARFRSRNEPMEDVVQVGTIGLINAIDRFDPDRGVQFPTFAMPTVVGEIKRYFRDNVRTVHVPRRLHELWVQVNGATEDLTVLHGRSPTTAEIAERLKLTEEDVLACIEAGRSYHATSLEAAQEGDGLPGLLDRLGYEDPALAGVEHRDLVRHLLVQLPEREQRILLLRYYNNLTQSQISVELGVSQMHVSRLLSRSFARLRSANRIEA